MKAIIDDGCIGCGICAEICGEVFKMSDDGMAEVYAEVTADLEDSAHEAAEACPVSIIHIKKD